MSFLPDTQIGTAPILGTTLGEENTYGAVAGRTPSGPVTFARVSTVDVNGCLRAYVGEGRFTDDSLSTFGSRAVVEAPELQKLMRLHLQERIRTSRRNERLALCGDPERGVRNVSRVARLHAQVT